MNKRIIVLLLGVVFIPIYSSSQCVLTSLNISVSACDPSDNSFEINGSIDFQDPPISGQLIIEDCNGNQQTLNAPFSSPISFTLSDIDSDGTTGCELTAYFSDEPTCSITSSQFQYPQSCTCNADLGTFSENLNGVPTSMGAYTLCYGDELDITGNGDFVAPQDVNMPGVTYDPGVFLMVYDCPPTVFNPDDINTDTCFVGIESSNDQDWTIINNVGDNSTKWFVPVTIYSMVDVIYAVSLNGGDWCYDMGPAYEVTFLEEYVSSINPIMEDTLCSDGGTISLTASDTSGTWYSNCGACLDSNGLFNIGLANIGSNTVYYSVGDSVCNVQDSLTLFIEDCSSISENEMEEVSIYPNPASFLVNISAESHINTLKVVDLQGRLHDDFNMINSLHTFIDLNEYSEGVYFVQISTDTGVFKKKLIVKY